MWLGTDASGRAALNQAPITGESLPVDKQAGDLLYAGSIVADGVVEASVTASAGDSTLARIALAIQSAQSRRAPTQRFVDQFARCYTPAVVVFAIAVAILGGAVHLVDAVANPARPFGWRIGFARPRGAVGLRRRGAAGIGRGIGMGFRAVVVTMIVATGVAMFGCLNRQA